MSLSDCLSAFVSRVEAGTLLSIVVPIACTVGSRLWWPRGILMPSHLGTFSCGGITRLHSFDPALENGFATSRLLWDGGAPLSTPLEFQAWTHQASPRCMEPFIHRGVGNWEVHPKKSGVRNKRHQGDLFPKLKKKSGCHVLWTGPASSYAVISFRIL